MLETAAEFDPGQLPKQTIYSQPLFCPEGCSTPIRNETTSVGGNKNLIQVTRQACQQKYWQRLKDSQTQWRVGHTEESLSFN